MAAVAAAAAYAPVAGGARSAAARARSCVHCAGDERAPTPPVGLKPLTEQEVVDKLNAVPAFAVVNGAEQMLATPGGPSGEPACCFYLELSEAQAAIDALRAANPKAAIDLSVQPLGTAYALAEWQQQTDPDEVADPSASFDFDDDDPDPDLEPPLRSAAVRPEAVPVRLQASQAEAEVAAEALGESPAPPLLRRRNRREGPIPLFGSNEIRYEVDGAAADGASSLMPLFFRRQDLAAAWQASGAPAESLPEVQVTDLRTLVWQMRFDMKQDWRPMLFVAPDDAIEFVREQQERLGEYRPEPEAKMGEGPLSRSDVQGLIFGGNDEMPGSGAY